MEFVYDHDCGFCTRVVQYFSPRVRDVEFVPSYRYERATTTDLERTAMAVVNGREYTEHMAIAMLLRRSTFLWRMAGNIIAFKPIAPFARRIYRWVSANRKSTLCKIPTQN
ncbi:thiol-disulfide oxidoreductase DCC family protein [Arcanobacterium canis]